ncbi:endonuclease MutS2 [Pseudalkalibacillus caeni]|uniref:endonuclease MutS2 n=1 Tax=Exobacillus caeni TaxID=2574798 RepID=UPI001FEAFFA4|nr:endonuclease MutS2 [Pseudalkalibacillus caeni]
MNETAFKMLEFEKIKKELAQFALSELAKGRIEKLSPSTDYSVVRNWLSETTEAKEIIMKSSSVPLHGLQGISQVLKQFNKGIPFRPELIVVIMDLLESGKKLQQFMIGKEYLAPQISTYVYSISELGDLFEELSTCIKNNSIDDHASKELLKIRKKIRVLEDRIKEKLDTVLRSPAKRKYLQDTIISQRDGHYVIAVRAEYRKNIKGQIHDRSASGSTVFIEPEEVRRVQTELNELRADEYLEEQRILSTLTGLIESRQHELTINVETMAHYDFIFAKAKYSMSIGAREVELVKRNMIKINEGKHPLLGVSAVPLQVAIGEDFNSLVITGPNTGGKTVAIKTVGLLALMVQSGMHVPVGKGSKFGVFEKVLVDIGDGQSIEQSLSTFSSRITNIIEILKDTNSNSLVIIDELGSGTDPGEGMGLAVSILEQLNGQGATMLATTHYSEIKAFAENHPDFCNGSMEFDLITLKPLYRLIMGKAGESQAFSIALRLGLHPSIIERAHEVTYKEKKKYEAFQRDSKALLAQEQQLESTQTLKKKATKTKVSSDYSIGDSVNIPSMDTTGIVFKPEDESGNLIVMVKGEKMKLNHKRVSLHLPARELYPEGYDFDILFETKEDRKKKRQMEKGHVEGLSIEYASEE